MKPFEILIWSIVALALIFIAITAFTGLFPKEDLLGDIKNNLSLAETSTHAGEIIFVGNYRTPGEFLISQTTFDLTKRSVAIECTSQTDCCNIDEKCSKTEWSNTHIFFKQSKQVNVFLRCYTDVVSICKIYFGKIPPQANISKIELVENDNGNLIFSLKTKNTGQLILAHGESHGKILKKVNDEWEETDITTPTKLVDTLLPGQSFSFIHEFDIKTPGEYQVEFIFLGNNAGFDKNYLEFNVEANLNCKTSEGEEILFNNDPTKRSEKRFCEGCNFGYECYTAWKTKNLDKNWIILDKDSVYYETNIPREELFTENDCLDYETKYNYSCNYGEEYCPDSEYPLIHENSYDLCCCYAN
jgi:hypothetical protein